MYSWSPQAGSSAEWNGFTTSHCATASLHLEASLPFLPLAFLFDTLCIPVTCLGAKGVKSHHTTGSVRGLSLLSAPVRSVEGALLSRGTGDPRSTEHNLLEICQVYAKASRTLTEME